MNKSKFEHNMPAGLPDLGQMNQAPEGYFEQFPNIVIKRINNRRKLTVTYTLIRIAAAAAILTGIWAGISTLTEIRTKVPTLSFNELELFGGTILLADITEFSGILMAGEESINDLENTLFSDDNYIFINQETLSADKQEIFDYLFENIEN
ncbi:MAG TPA: hypothetical protein VLH16_00160 [Bacteroidales bacterium]|nr:hypothetical protein [Bacteroidales bacterium]